MKEKTKTKIKTKMTTTDEEREGGEDDEQQQQQQQDEALMTHDVIEFSSFSERPLSPLIHHRKSTSSMVLSFQLLL